LVVKSVFSTEIILNLLRSSIAITSTVEDLNKFKIISVEKTDLTTNIKANLESDSYIFYKKVFNLYRIERYGLVKELKNFFHPEAIVLFGSFARGEDIEESDVDILIITKREERGETINLNKYEKLLKRDINLHLFDSLKERPKEFKNTVANGVVLYGYLKLL
jgi:predicted nucleotidyltransferase